MEAVAVPATINVENAAEVLESLRRVTGEAGVKPPALDLSPLRDFDSSALSLLLQLVRERGASHGSGSSAGVDAGGTGLGLSLLNPPPKLRALADVYGVDEMLFGAAASGARQETPS
jgi:phospholipid transport system transporter-binding protein